MINIILYPISIVPALLLYLWIRKKGFSDEEHRTLAGKALINGFKAILPVLLAGVPLLILGCVLNLRDGERIAGSFYYTFFILALNEEISKAYLLECLLKKNKTDYSWMHIILYMVCVAIGFDLLESALYAITTNAAQIIVRGLTFPHIGFGFITGYFIGMAIKNNKKALFVPAILITWILHGLYDFALSENVSETFETPAAITALSIAVISVILVVVLIRFIIRNKNNPKFTDVVI